MHTVLSIQRKQNLKGWLLLLKSVIVLLIYYFWLHFHAGKCQLMQSIFQTENADKALKYRLYRHLPAYEKIIRNLVSFYVTNNNLFLPTMPDIKSHITPSYKMLEITTRQYVLILLQQKNQVILLSVKHDTDDIHSLQSLYCSPILFLLLSF